jgi:hypothetical protein
MKLYMFRTVPLSIIRSLFTVHSAMAYVIQVCRQLSSRTRMVYCLVVRSVVSSISGGSTSSPTPCLFLAIVTRYCCSRSCSCCYCCCCCCCCCCPAYTQNGDRYNRHSINNLSSFIGRDVCHSVSLSFV